MGGFLLEVSSDAPSVVLSSWDIHYRTISWFRGEKGSKGGREGWGRAGETKRRRLVLNLTLKHPDRPTPITTLLLLLPPLAQCFTLAYSLRGLRLQTSRVLPLIREKCHFLQYHLYIKFLLARIRFPNLFFTPNLSPNSSLVETIQFQDYFYKYP